MVACQRCFISLTKTEDYRIETETIEVWSCSSMYAFAVPDQFFIAKCRVISSLKKGGFVPMARGCPGPSRV